MREAWQQEGLGLPGRWRPYVSGCPRRRRVAKRSVERCRASVVGRDMRIETTVRRCSTPARAAGEKRAEDDSRRWPGHGASEAAPRKALCRPRRRPVQRRGRGGELSARAAHAHAHAGSTGRTARKSRGRGLVTQAPGGRGSGWALVLRVARGPQRVLSWALAESERSEEGRGRRTR